LAWRLNKKNMNWRQQEELCKEIYTLCKKSFLVEGSAEFHEDVRGHVFNTHEICVVPFGDVPGGLSPVCFKNDRIAAFASYNFLTYWKNTEFIYFSGIVVDPSLQGLNYGSVLIQEIMRVNNVKIVVLRTQSAVMYSSFAKVCKVYPSFDGKKIPGEIKNIGEYVAKNILSMSKYDSEEMIEKGTYHKLLYGKEPILDDSSLDKQFKQKVNATRGDSLIVVGTLK
jgi:GNAT superfamily N-acetyltransferase